LTRNHTPGELTAFQAAELSFALGTMASLIATINTLPPHPSLDPLIELANQSKDAYYRACDVLGITENTYVIQTNRQ
jgi:hypothetical protein